MRPASEVSRRLVHCGLAAKMSNFQDIFAASPQWTKRLLTSLAGRIQAMIQKLGS